VVNRAEVVTPDAPPSHHGTRRRTNGAVRSVKEPAPAGKRRVSPPKRIPRAGPAITAACTIIARNYRSHARILARSYLAQHPGSSFHVLVVDGLPPGEDFGVDGVEVVTSADLDLPYLYEMCFKYDVTELATALKPTFLSHLLNSGADRVVYVDPDVLISRPLAAVSEALDEASIVLTPHLSAPIPSDGLLPSEQDILIAGAYNLGFIGLKNSSETRELLAWWAERLRDLCRADPRQGLMVDQRWIDLVPTLFPNTRLVRDESYNVAYWNLHSRRIGRARADFTVNGQPLTFFHFSGFDPRRSHRLSKHQTRHPVKPGSALGALLERYAALHFEEGFEASSSWTYGLGAFDNGVPLAPQLRRLYLEFGEEARAQFGNPFASVDDNSFFAWATRDDPARRNLSPFLETVYRDRYDVATAFPDVGGGDRERFFEWAGTQGAAEMGYDPRLVNGMELSEQIGVAGQGRPLVHTSAPLPAGVNVCGYIRNESGLGTLARALIESVSLLDLDVALKDVSAQSVNRSDDPTFTEFDDAHPHPVNLICVNADQAVEVRAQAESFFQSRYNVGYWCWELPTFPAKWHDRFDLFDEIWVPSSLIANALAPVSPVPVVRMPPAVLAHNEDIDSDPLHRERGRAALKLRPDDCLFLFIFDFHSYFERKNPLAVVEAFKRAFSSSDSASLVIKCVNGRSDASALGRLRAAARGARIRIISEYVDRSQMSDLLAASDAYVSLHRCEGFGFTIAEAMSIGKPVIATGWSGNTDFMDVSNSYPVAFELAEIQKDVGPYEAGQIWAEPSIDHAASLMREVFDHPDAARNRGDAAREHIRKSYSPEQMARVLAERLSIIDKRSGPESSRSPERVELHRGNGHILSPIRETVAAHVNPSEVVAVISKGDPDLVSFDDRHGWHFPQDEDGMYAGYYPADDATAIDHLRALEAKGAGYFLVPATGSWWLDYYGQFREYLDANHHLVVSDEACTLYKLRNGHPSAHNPAVATPADAPTVVPIASLADAGIGEAALLWRLYESMPAELRLAVGRPTWSDRFMDWATNTVSPETQMSPFLEFIYRLRSDVAEAFPDILGPDREAFLAWAGTQGAIEMGYRPDLAGALAQEPQSIDVPREGPNENGAASAPRQGAGEGVEFSVRVIIEPIARGSRFVASVPANGVDGA
jgi:glycosyltransferase involved in cell wall biosynthesis